MAIAVTHNKKSLFIGDAEGTLKQLEVGTNKVLHSSPKLYHRITSIVITKDDQYLFFSDDWKGELRQWSIDQKKIVGNYGLILMIHRRCKLFFTMRVSNTLITCTSLS